MNAVEICGEIRGYQWFHKNYYNREFSSWGLRGSLIFSFVLGVDKIVDTDHFRNSENVYFKTSD